MIKDIALLFRHKLFLNNSSTVEKKRFGVLYLIFISAFLLFFITRTLNDVYIQLSRIVVQGVNYGDVYINFLLTLIAVFFILSFASMMSFQLKRNEEIDFLLTLPIKKSSIVSYQLLTSGIAMFFSLIMFLSPVIVFLSKRPLNEIIIGSFGVVINVLFIIFLGAIIAVLLSKIGSQKTARIVLIVVNMGMGAIYILMFQILPKSLSSPTEFPQALIKANDFFSSPYNVFILGLNGSDNVWYLLILIALTSLCGYSYYHLSNRMTFQQSTSSGKVKRNKRDITENRSNMILKKEFIIYKRHAQLVYYVFYPFGFSIFMGILNADIFSAIYMVSLMSPLFIAMQTSFSMNIEGSSIELTRMLPINLEKFVRIKLFVPVGINFILLLTTFIVFTIFLNIPIWSFLFIPLITLLQVLAALSGVNFILKKEPQKLNNPGAFLRSAGFLFQYLMLLILTLLTILPSSILIFQFGQTASTLWKIGVLASSAIGVTIAVILSIRFWKNIKRLIRTWN